MHHVVCHHPRNEVASALEWLQTLRVLKVLFPTLPPPLNAIDLDKLISALESLNDALLRSGIDVVQLLGGAQIYLLKRVLREYVMNLETTC